MVVGVGGGADDRHTPQPLLLLTIAWQNRGVAQDTMLWRVEVANQTTL